MRITGFLVTAALSLFISTAFAGELPPVDPLVYPHDGNQNCQVCHLASERKLKSWFASVKTKKTLREDLNRACLNCHDVALGHGVGKAPEMNVEGLPLDDAGNITCAITCHNMHVKEGDALQVKFHLRLPQMKLCLSCHRN